MSRVKIGVVGVDSGQVLICDPCYIDSEWQKREFTDDAGVIGEFSYNGACKATLSEITPGSGQLHYRLGHAGAGVASRTGWGDGEYPVYANIDDKTGRVRSLTIKFD